MKRLRISAISFLNTAPLMWDFEHGEQARELAKHFEIAYTVPALCAEALRKGEADIGIIPAIAYQTIPDLLIIPDVVIAAEGAVESIILVSKVPLAKIATVAVDNSSRTSVALLEILFRNGWLTGQPVAPEFKALPPNLGAMLHAADAALLIGDPALTVDRAAYQVIDLADCWRQHTGCGFVFAFWAVRKVALDTNFTLERLTKIFRSSRERGLANVKTIARTWAPRVGISEGEVVRYLTQNVNFYLTPSAAKGMELFFSLARQFGILSQARDASAPVSALAAK